MQRDNLKRYVLRVAARYYPELDTIADLEQTRPVAEDAA
jgi:hypothetical protein